MRFWLMVVLCCTSACDAFLKLNPEYCEDDATCAAAGLACDMMARRCVPPESLNALSVTAITPAATWRAGGNTLVMTGHGFAPDSQVRINGIIAPTFYISSTELRVTAPSSGCGQATVVVENFDGSQAMRNDLLRFRAEPLSFAVGPSLSLDSASFWMIGGNLNTDQATDLVVGSSMTPSLQLLANNGSGTFFMQAPSGLTETYRSGHIKDYDDDGVPDLATWNSMHVTFAPGPSFSVMTQLALPNLDVVIVDLNDDKLDDVVAVDSTGNRLLTALGAGSFVFGAGPTTTLPTASSRLVAGDFDHDGKPDVAVLPTSDHSVTYCIPNPSGALNCSRAPIVLGGPPIFVGQVDVDFAGTKAEVVVSDEGLETKVSIILNGTTGMKTQQLSAFKNVQFVALQDMDCDGLKDLVMTHTTRSTLDIYLNLGDGNFATTATMIELGTNNMNPLDGMVVMRAAAGDSLLSIATLRETTSNPLLHVYRNTSP